MTRREQIEAMAATFDSVAHLLQASIERGPGLMRLGNYREGVLTGAMQLWVDEGYAAVTEVLNYPDSRIVLVHVAGGELGPLVEADGELEKFARVVGAEGIMVSGRKGWARALRSRGYSEVAVQLFKGV